MVKRKFCRFCLYEEQIDSNNILIDCFNTHLKSLLNHLENINIFIKEDDSIPSLICEKCLEFINKISEFLETVRESERELYQIYNETERKDKDDIIEEVRLSKYLQINGEETKQFKNDNISDFHECEILRGHDFIANKSKNKLNKSRSCIEPNSKKYLNNRNIAFNDNEMCNTNSSGNEEIIENKLPDSTHFSEGHKIDIYNTQLKNAEIKREIFICNLCPREFNNIYNYKNHQHCHNEQYIFCCSKCNEIFSNQNDVIKHERTHKVTCAVCNMEVLPKSLSAHLKKHTDLYKCTHCHSRHSSRAALLNHFGARHAGIKGYVCHICGKQNSCQASMKRHLATHLTIKPFKCKTCGFATKSKTVLKVHILRKHNNRATECDICNKIFKSQLSLNQHKKRIHEPKKHNCNHCGKSFSEKFNLDQHVTKKHSQQRVYECKECHQEFFTVRKLKEHMHTHRTGCVSCEKCGKEFFYKKYFQKHLQKCIKI